MASDPEHPESATSLRLDIATAKVLVWFARARGLEDSAGLSSEAHLFFFDRYQRLAEYHRARGRAARALRLQAKADEHWEESGGNEPPRAAAMAMPRPRAWTRTDAVGGRWVRKPKDVA